MALSADDIDALVERIIHGAEERYVAELTKRLVDSLMDGVFSYREAVNLDTLARANKYDIDRILLAWQDAISKEVEDNIREVLAQSDNADVASLEAIYGHAVTTGAAAAARAAGRSEHFAEIAHQTARGLSDIIARQNIALTANVERMWYEVAGEAIAAINHGLKPRDKVIADAVSKLAAAGIETINYKSGISNQLDVAVRRHLVSQTSQIGGEMTLARMKQYGHELAITSAHYGARPSHAAWQGRPCCVSGSKVVSEVQYPGLVELTGYGTIGGLKGVNCRHSIGPYFPGITKLPDLDFPDESVHFGMTSDQHYAATQRQRELERRVRKTKREVVTLERAGLGLESPSYVQKRLVLGRQQRNLRAHVTDNKLVRQPQREKAYGVGAQPRALSGAAAKAYVIANRGRTNVAIDRFVPCLLDTKTGELVDTEVCRFLTRSQLAEYNSKSGWDINWSKVSKDVDIYGLTLKGSSELQGLVALKADADAQAVYLHYAKTAPRNDKRETGRQDYEGVGGHLFALAVDISQKAGFGGYCYGFAEDKKLERHYVEKLGATHIGRLHPFHFILDERAAQKLLKEYNY
ncbi:phage minor capsid protein, partial [Gordonibacter sp.]|uniref:phage minor capsid protein n=1 Tax=Gordonibacter sp. TaxID=1968902 RepID=UPI002FCA51EF